MTERVIRTVEHGISYDEHVLVKHQPQRSNKRGTVRLEGCDAF